MFPIGNVEQNSFTEYTRQEKGRNDGTLWIEQSE
jgi:hypothetical protein